MKRDVDPLFASGLTEEVAKMVAGDSSFAIPDELFRAEDSSEQDNLRHGLPPAPERGDPAYDLWLMLAGAVGKSVAGPLEGSDSFATTYNRLATKGHFETSRNWSGAVISAPYHHRPFGQLLATWMVPTIALPVGQRGTSYACSTWIGFDGHRRTSRSLPQAGIFQRITQGGPSETRAWKQWWWPKTCGPEYFKSFPVSPGDKIVASLFIMPESRILITMMAKTPQGRVSFLADTLVPPQSVTVRGLEAECILERPKPVADDKRSVAPGCAVTSKANYMLPRYADTTFQCYVFPRGSRRSRDMRGGRILRMVHEQAPAGIETLSAPIRNPGTRFVTVRYTGLQP